MWRRWKIWLLGGWALSVVLALTLLTMVDHRDLRQRRDLLGTMQSACKLYARDHGEAMPPDLRTLFPQYIHAPSLLAYSSNDVDYFPGATGASDPNTVLLQEKRLDRHGRRWVAHVDMSLDLLRTHRAFSAPP